MRMLLAAALVAVGLMSSASAQFVRPDAAAQAARPQVVAMEYGYWPPAYALAQQRALNKAFEGLAPQRPGVRDVYILSVAMHGEHVFENEASQGAAVLAQHFNAANRTIILSNNRAAGAVKYPAATATHFQASLGAIAEAMDKNEDVAVIFVTTHGGQGLGLGGYEPAPGGEKRLKDFSLPPGTLRGALESSGIKNRIVILSACFAGQFIPTLQDPNTLVMTAASSTTSSFGCVPENDWTYFGDALFQKSLPGSPSLISSFDNAKKLIAQWETEQKLVPSQPQIFVGAEMGKLLPQIEKR